MPEYSEEILDSNSISSTDKAGRPIPVTIPIALAPGIKVVYTTRLGGLSAGDYGNLNLGGKSGDEPEAVLSNRIALAEAVQARLSLVSPSTFRRGCGRGRLVRHQHPLRLRRVRHTW